MAQNRTAEISASGIAAHRQRGQVTMAIPDAAFSALRFYISTAMP